MSSRYDANVATCIRILCMNTLLKLWRGQFGLPMTYWGFGVLGTILVLAPVEFCTSGSTASLLVGFSFCFYMVIVNVGIWRAATRYIGPIFWAGLAKLIALFSILALAVLVVGSVVAPVRVPKATTAPARTGGDQLQPRTATPQTFTYEEAYDLPATPPQNVKSKSQGESDWEKGAYAPPKVAN